jgi:3alpha(or 20beta)-hydroxysteroid dehydrogenase
MKGKHVLVTGASRGLGLADCLLFNQEDAAVIIMTGNDTDQLEEAAETVRQAGNAEVVTCKLDVTNESDWKAAAEFIDKKFGKLDVLINNAGINKRDSFVSCTLEDWQRIIAVNQTGVFLGMKNSLELLKKSGKASIVNMSSITGMTGYYAVAYTAAKWAVRGMTKSAAMEFGRWGIRVNAVLPGFIWTPLNEAIRDIVQHFNEMNVLGRAGEAFEVAKAVLFLASDDSSYMTGAELVVDGGLMSGGQFMAAARKFGFYRE